MHKILFIHLCSSLLILSLFTGWPGYASPEPKIEAIKPPEWILGHWSNLGESNDSRIVYFIFKPDEIEYTSGIGQSAKVENWKTKYKDYQIIQTYSDDIYKIKFIKNDSHIFYEFKLHKAKPNYMTYAISKDGHYLINHSDSINNILFR